MERYDIAVIGSGPSGLEAAITATIRNKKTIVFGHSGGSQKVEKSHMIDNYLGLPHISGADLMGNFLDHAQRMNVNITDEKIAMVLSMGDYFSIQTSKNDVYEATCVILAAGVSTGKTYPGEEEFLGRGVSYCATCDAALYRERTAAIVGFSAEEEAEADFMSEYASKVYYFPQYVGAVNVRDGVEVIREKPVSVEGQMKATTFVTDANRYEVDGVFFLRESIAPSNLVPGIETDGRHIIVDRSMSTNLPGCFAAGDITGTPYQLTKAAGEGNIAALSAVSYIDKKRREGDA